MKKGFTLIELLVVVAIIGILENLKGNSNAKLINLDLFQIFFSN